MADQPRVEEGSTRWRAALPRRAPTATTASNGANGAAAAERIEVLNPATGEAVGSIQVDTPRDVAATVARVRANQPEWEAIGIEGRYHWLGKLRDWLLDNAERIADTMQAETGKVRGRHRHRAVLPHRPDQLLRDQGGEVHRRGEPSAPTRRCSPRRSSAIQYRPHPVVGVISPWNFPLALAPRRRDPGPAGRRRGRRQALRVHPAGPGRGGQGLEGGDRRPRRLRLRARHRRDRRRPGRRRRLHPVHRLRPDRPQGDGPRRRDADPGQPRARRQGPDDRPRRRRPRPRRQRRGLGRDVQLRPDLHLGRADLRRGARLRRVRRQADQGGRRPAPGRRRPHAPKRTSAR